MVVGVGFVHFDQGGEHGPGLFKLLGLQVEYPLQLSSWLIRGANLGQQTGLQDLQGGRVILGLQINHRQVMIGLNRRPFQGQDLFRRCLSQLQVLFGQMDAVEQIVDAAVFPGQPQRSKAGRLGSPQLTGEEVIGGTFQLHFQVASAQLFDWRA